MTETKMLQNIETEIEIEMVEDGVVKKEREMLVRREKREERRREKRMTREKMAEREIKIKKMGERIIAHQVMCL